jgi:hypothetical protein
VAKISNIELNTMFLNIRKRAERYNNEQLVNTFVNAGLLMEALSNDDHQILYGRRGTGKTHAFSYLFDRVSGSGGVPIYIDISRLGSDVSIYNDIGLPISERAVRLLRDVLNDIHDRILEFVINSPEYADQLERFSGMIDTLASVMPAVEIYGSTEVESTEGSEKTLKKSAALSVFKEPKVDLGGEIGQRGSMTVRSKDTGTKRYSVRFADVGGAMAALLQFLHPRRVWIFIDEWSSLLEDIQPFLADMLRKSFFNIGGITVKIAAIEHRSRFYIEQGGAQYIGFELGADISTGLNLDDYLVFENDERQSTQFFGDLFVRHIKSIAQERGVVTPDNLDELVSNGFTQDKAFQELVRASEGVPRDAIYILASAAQKSNTKSISTPAVRQAARTFFQTDKSNVINSNPTLAKMLSFIIDTVIGDRKTSIFLVETGHVDDNINRLFDRRILHIKSRSASSRDYKGKRFVVYKIDFGCYIDLVYTKRYPRDVDLSQALDVDGVDELASSYSEDDDEKVGAVEVPQDDKRSYRSAVLDLTRFYQLLEAEQKQEANT